MEVGKRTKHRLDLVKEMVDSLLDHTQSIQEQAEGISDKNILLKERVDVCVSRLENLQLSSRSLHSLSVHLQFQH